MKLFFLGLFLVVINFCGKTQEFSTNPVIYLEFLMGGAGGSADGMVFGSGLNYQQDKHLFTFRVNIALQPGVKYYPPVFVIPTMHLHSRDWGILYGWRFVKHGRSLSFSAGVSTTLARHVLEDSLHSYRISHEHNIGLPFEANIKWFKSNRERYRLYLFIPVGRPTSFGRSIGFKFFGNVSKYTYYGLGLTYSLGAHKEYYQ